MVLRCLVISGVHPTPAKVWAPARRRPSGAAMSAAMGLSRRYLRPNGGEADLRQGRMGLPQARTIDEAFPVDRLTEMLAGNMVQMPKDRLGRDVFNAWQTIQERKRQPDGAAADRTAPELTLAGNPYAGNATGETAPSGQQGQGMSAWEFWNHLKSQMDKDEFERLFGSPAIGV